LNWRPPLCHPPNPNPGSAAPSQTSTPPAARSCTRSNKPAKISTSGAPPLTDQQIDARPYDLAPVAFHLRHIARSLDRLLTYAEGHALDASQLAALGAELDPGATTCEAMAELRRGLETAAERIRKLPPEIFDQPRGVGRQALPTTVGSLLVHCAEHTQRHVAQAITTAKIIAAPR
jgi:hypothetical protein